MEDDMPLRDIPGGASGDVFARLQAADPTRDMQVDLTALRQKIEALTAGQITADAPVIALDDARKSARKSAGESAAAKVAARQVDDLELVSAAGGQAGDNVVAMPRRHRRWIVTVGAAAAAAVVGVTVVTTSLGGGQLPPTAGEGSSKVSAENPLTVTLGAFAADPQAKQRLEQVGEVTFEAAGAFSEEHRQAAGFKVSSAEVSTSSVSSLASALGLDGSVKKTGSGYQVSGPAGAKLVVTIGGLTTLSYKNPSALPLVCVPVSQNGEDGQIELPRDGATGPASTPEKTGSGSTPTKGTTPPVTGPEESGETLQPDENYELPRPEPTGTPEGTMAPPVKPGEPTTAITTPNVTPAPSATGATNSEATNSSASKTSATEIASTLPGKTATSYLASTYATVQAAPTAVALSAAPTAAVQATRTPAATAKNTVPSAKTPDSDGASGAPSATSQPSANTSTQMATPATTNQCVWKVGGKAPDAQSAVAQVAKVAAALGAQTRAEKATVQSSEGVTTVVVPVSMPGQDAALTWKATVTENGVASIDGSLGSAKKAADYRTISEAEAVKRLNDPKYGPLDVTLPAGASDKVSSKITGEVKLVKAELSTAPVKQKDGSVLSLPVYLITDTQGRIWTVLAVAE